MIDKDEIISGFSREGQPSPFVVDFNLAKRIDRGGTTCDTYECTVQRRHLFVKRLKAEFRNNPLYRAAFDKEYDLGVGLNHISLPHYVGYGDDYLIMDFIEGDTLADLIKRNDPRLKNRRFVKKLLGELIDVVEYLHTRNVVHCDIKPDNIIISPHSDRPLTLIDLDKAYTSWLETTHGNVEKYDCEGCADGQIDFKGIGLIAGKLGMKRFAAICRRKELSAASLRKALDGHGAVKKLLIWIVALIAIAGVIVMALRNDIEKTEESQQATKVDTVEIVNNEVPLETPVDTGTSVKKAEEPVTPASVTPKSPENVDDIVKKHYDKLYKRHDYLRTLAADKGVTSNQLQIVIKSYTDDQKDAQRKIISEVMTRYGLSDPLEAHAILGTSEEWKRFMAQDFEINQLYCREIDLRTAEEQSNQNQSD